MEFQIAVVDRTTTFVGDNRAVQHCVRGDTIAVSFDTEWNAVDKKAALFVNRADGTRRTIEMQTDEVAIPWEVLRTAGEMYVTFYGYYGELDASGIRIVTKLMDRPFVVQDAYGVDLVGRRIIKDKLHRILYGVDDIDAATERATLAAIRAEDAAATIGTSTVTRAEYDETVNALAGMLANYVGRLWYLNRVLYVPNEMAEVTGDVLRVAGTYDPETQTLWIGEING